MPEAFRPVNAQQAAFLADVEHRYVLASGGWGSGKSVCGAQKLAELHLLNSGITTGVMTGCKSLCLAPTYQMVVGICVPRLREAFERIGLGCEYLADPKRSCMVLPDLGTKDRPSEVLLRSADAADRIAGFEVGAIWCDEAARFPWSDHDPLRDALIQASGRLRDTSAIVQQMLVTTTPEGSAHRVWRDFIADPKPGHAAYFFKTSENPHAVDFDVEQRKYLTPELQRQYLDGVAVDTVGGRVYPQFDSSPAPAGNVEPRLVLDRHLPLQLSIDFNIDPGCHAIVGQHFPLEKIFTAVHELHAPRMDVRGLAAALVSLVADLGGWQWPELEVFGDASGAAKHAAHGDSSFDVLQMALSRTGWPFRLRVRSKNPAVSDRVNAVNLALAGFDGVRRYLIHPRCVRLVADLRGLHFDGGEIDKSDRRRSHASDADGYRIYQIAPPRMPLESGGAVAFASGDVSLAAPSHLPVAFSAPSVLGSIYREGR